MKVRNSGPVIAACMGRRIVHSPPRKPAASPEKKLDAASAHSSAVTMNPLLCSESPGVRGDRLLAWPGRRGSGSVGQQEHRPGSMAKAVADVRMKAPYPREGN